MLPMALPEGNSILKNDDNFTVIHKQKEVEL
jgi:hypothetical protein